MALAAQRSEKAELCPPRTKLLKVADQAYQLHDENRSAAFFAAFTA
jgi:hypothetical protein